MSKSTSITRSRERVVFSNNEYRITKVSDLLLSSSKKLMSNHDSVNEFLRIHGNMELGEIAKKWPKVKHGQRYHDLYPFLSDSILNVIRDSHIILYKRMTSKKYYQDKMQMKAASSKTYDDKKANRVDSFETLTLVLTRQEFFKFLLNKTISKEFAQSINLEDNLTVTTEVIITG